MANIFLKWIKRIKKESLPEDYNRGLSKHEDVKLIRSIKDYAGEYDGNDHSCIIETEPDCDVQYSVNGEQWSTDKPVFKTTGIFTCYIRVRKGLKTEEERAEIIITKRNVDISVGEKIYIYGFPGQKKSMPIRKTVTVDKNDFVISGLYSEFSESDVGEYVTRITGKAVVTDGSGEDVSEQFEVTVHPGRVIIEKSKLVLRSRSLTKEYDGRILSDEKVEIEGYLVEDDLLEVKAVGLQLLPGVSVNRIEYSFGNETAYANYIISVKEGRLSVTDRTQKYMAVIDIPSEEKVYDGAVLSYNYQLNEEKDIDGCKYTIKGLSYALEETEPGTYIVRATGRLQVIDRYGNDVVSQFAITINEPSITIRKRSLSIYSAYGEKEYDGLDLERNSVYMKGDGLLADHKMSCSAAGKQNLVGSSVNHIEYHFEKSGVEKYYDIKLQPGILTVKNRSVKIPLEIPIEGRTITYTGSETKIKYELNKAITINGASFTFSGLSYEIAVFREGEYRPEWRGVVCVKDRYSNDVSAQFSVTVNASPIIVEPAAVPKNAIWVDGKPYLSKADVARAYGISPSVLYAKLKKGWTYEQIVGLEEYVPPSVTFRDKTYNSEQDLAEAFDIPYTAYKTRISRGWTMDEALGIIPRIPEDRNLSGKSFTQAEMPPGMKKIYEENPYCVLGISAVAARKTALDKSISYDTFTKLGIPHKAEYDLVNVSPPNREKGHVQTVMMNLDKMQFRWLWLIDPVMASVWSRKVLETFDKSDIKYDEMLVCMFNRFIGNSGYTDSSGWKKLLLMLDRILSKNDEELKSFIQDHVVEEDNAKYNYHMIVRSFRETILKPFTNNIEKQSVYDNARLLLILKDINTSFKDSFIQKIADATISWIDYETELIAGVSTKVEERSKDGFCFQDAQEVLDSIEYFDSKQGFEKIELIATAFRGIGLYSEMMQEKIRKTIWNATDIVNRGGNGKKAAHYDSKIYMYCNKEQREQLKKIYRIEDMTIPDTEITIADCNAAADRYKNAENPDLEFRWRLKAAEKGSPSAMTIVGLAYALGRGITKDRSKAVEWYRKAAEKGEPYACYILASWYSSGILPGGLPKAREYWIKSFIYGQHNGAKEELDKHFPGWKNEKIEELEGGIFNFDVFLEPNADAGLLYAQFLMGKKYHEGPLLWKKDDDKAKEWLIKAAEAGSADASLYLAENFGISINSETDDQLDDYILDSSNFTDEVIYEGPVHIEFCGADLDFDETCKLQFWIRNHSERDISLWARSICVDGAEIEGFSKLGVFTKGNSGFCTLELNEISPVAYYEVGLELEIDDVDNNTLYDACSLEFELTGDGDSDFEISYTRLGEPVVEKKAPSTTNSFFCPGSRYERNYTLNGIEIYFPSKPGERIRNYLKADGWRWHPSKECWYTYYSDEHLSTAKAITGQY